MNMPAPHTAPSVQPPPGATAALTPDTRREIGARLRELINSSGKQFSEVSKQSSIPAGDLSSITRGNMEITGAQLGAILPVLSVSRSAFVTGLSVDALAFVDRIFPERPPAAAPDDAPARNGKVQSGPRAASAARPIFTQPPDRARARRAGGAQASDNSGQPAARWGEPTFGGELTYESFAQCLGPEFARTDRQNTEISFTYTSGCQIEVKVWTTLDARTGRAKPLGSDAIRVVVYDVRAKRKIMAWSSVHKRVGDCMDRLEAVVGLAVLRAKKRPRCFKCNTPLKICGYNEDQFWGCPNYKTARHCDGLRWLSMSGQDLPVPKHLALGPAPPAPEPGDHNSARNT